MIVVFGGTGQVGRQIVDLLRAQGRPVRIATRAPDRISPELRGTVEAAQCDLLDGSSLTAALAGAEVVVCTAHGGEGRRGNGPRGVEGRGIPQLIQAARRLPLRQFIYVSTASASPDSPAEFFRLKAQAEAQLRDSGISFSILRPTHLLETWVPMLAKPLATRSRAVIIGSGTNPVSWVAGGDVASAAARLAGEPGHGITADLGGPQPLTLRQLNSHLERALGIIAQRTITMSHAMLGVGHRLLRPISEVMSRQMQLGLLLDIRPQTANSLSAWQRVGVTPTTAGQWIEAHLPQMLAEWGVTSPGAHGRAMRKATNPDGRAPLRR
jgi:uncharacterized protein YbjT (DUF2867 family)